MYSLFKFLVALALVLLALLAVLVLLDGVLYCLKNMFSISWKKFFIGVGAVFGFLWLRDFFKERRNARVVEESTEPIEEADFEVVNEE